MARLHRQYAGEDGPTDVLSFADGSIEAEAGTRYYGDVFVCVPVAERQARAAGHAVDAEVRLLAVHGVLHLLGHEHGQRRARERMWAAQAEILAQTDDEATGRGPSASPSGGARSRIASFGHAWAGWWYVLRTQRNAWIHAFASLSVVAVAAWLGLQTLEWALLLAAIALVWTAEFLNTALEAVVDLASPQIHPLGRVGKDVGAAAVLIAAAAAATIGALVLGPPLLERLAALR
jgi:rRNA maturation RNase YbeY